MKILPLRWQICCLRIASNMYWRHLHVYPLTYSANKYCPEQCSFPYLLSHLCFLFISFWVFVIGNLSCKPSFLNPNHWAHGSESVSILVLITEILGSFLSPFSAYQLSLSMYLLTSISPCVCFINPIKAGLSVLFATEVPLLTWQMFLEWMNED